MSPAEVGERSHITPQRTALLITKARIHVPNYLAHGCWFAEFEGLKRELERLLVRNRGLTRLGSPKAAAVSSRSSSGSQRSSQRGSNARVSTPGSLHASSTPSSSNGSSSSFSGALLGAADSQTLHTEYPISAAEHASMRLNHDVDILLREVESVMAAPVLQLPAWFTRKAATPARMATEFLETNATPTHSSPISVQHRVVTPKLKASSVSPPDMCSKPSHIGAAVSRSSSHVQQASAAPHAQTVCPKFPTAAVGKPTRCSALHDCSNELASTSAAAPQLPDEPDNLAILHVACSVSPSDSHDTSTSIRSSQPAHVESPLSPNCWHTNHVADRDSPDLSSSSPPNSGQPASASSSMPCTAHTEAEHSMCTEGDGVTNFGGNVNSKLISVPNDDGDDEHSENVAPGWHRQPLQRVSSAQQSSTVDQHASRISNVPERQQGLIEGYVRGSNAKLQLPASVRTGSRKTALSVRTPLKTITEVRINTCSTFHA